MKVWISTYALTRGIFELEVEVSLVSPQMVVNPQNAIESYWFEGKEWHRTEIEAIRRAEEMRDKKIASLQAQMTKLSAISFRSGRPPEKQGESL